MPHLEDTPPDPLPARHLAAAAEALGVSFFKEWRRAQDAKIDEMRQEQRDGMREVRSRLGDLDERMRKVETSKAADAKVEKELERERSRSVLRKMTMGALVAGAATVGGGTPVFLWWAIKLVLEAQHAAAAGGVHP